MPHSRIFLSIFAASGFLVACGSDSVSIVGLDAGIPSAVVDSGAASADAGVDAETTTAVAYRVGGTVTGLTGTGLVLQNNGGDDVPIAADGSFTFPTAASTGAAFGVTVKTQPTAPVQSCVVSGGSGTVVNGNVTSVVVSCSVDHFAVGGTITGLAGTGLVLQDNAGSDLVANANGTFAFATTVASGGAYAVTVKSQPADPTQTCTVASDNGTVDAAAITSVAVTCTTNTYTVGGTVTGVAGKGLVLRSNGANDLAVAADGKFTFATPILSGQDFTVTIAGQPSSPTQTCTLAGDTGKIGGSNVTSVAVNCTTNAYTVSGTASGVVGAGLVLTIDGIGDVGVTANGAFAFAKPVPSGTSYAVKVKSQPSVPTQTCVLGNESGTIVDAAVSNVTLACTTDRFAIGGAVTGLAGKGLVLEDNAGDDYPVAADGTFTFPTTVASGDTYAVTVKQQPTDLSQSCVVTRDTGKVAATAITDVAVTCTTSSFTVGGTVSGLTGAGLVLQDNAGDDLAVAASGAFTFQASVLSGKPYAVTVKTQPTGPSQSCTVSADTGTVTNGNVVSVNVNCATNKFTVGGTVSGLKGTGLVLQDNGSDNLTVNNNGTFAFATTVTSGQTYAVKVKTNPTNPSQTCTLTGDAGTVGAAKITDVSVACTTNTYVIGGTVSGLAAGESLTLKNNGDDALAIGGNGSFVFATPVASGATYSVAISATSAPTKVCFVTNGSGTVASSAVSTVAITCNLAKVCLVGNDAYTGSQWTVCTSSATEAWLSAVGGGSYHATKICQSLGYSRLGAYGGTCGNTCGYCEGKTSCSAPGKKTFDGGGLGSDANGLTLGNTVTWQCLP